MDKKKAAATALATTIAASGAAVDATFDSPQDILQNTYVEPVVDYVTPDGTIDDDGTTQDDEDKGKQAVTAAKKTVREWVLELPLWVRAIVVVPLWLVGNLVMYAGHLVIVGLSPVWGSILNLLMLAGVLTAAFTIAAKAMFPDVPLRKILNKRTFKGILIAAVFVFLLDLALKVGWPPYMQYRTIAIALFTLAVLFLLVMRFGRRENKRRRKEREMAEAARHTVDEAKARAAALLSAAETDAETRKEHIMASVQTEIGELILSASQKLLNETGTPESNSRLYDEFIRIAESTIAPAGKNGEKK